ncbi:PREDICTED: integrator complex subunit 12-like [Dufourea novaeangliae]|uniref:Integrator complex subunit 12 n=1 Tax=Dufourea novaeangliae TaxID=178035 RepID=A0A154P843_DUFNO|nr:PREDICTED: integrator complex subunit 12-like [Dufourea novaeangliae]KZC08095.1 Integrator complex subunit 12 [Dufourea novaeangliae]
MYEDTADAFDIDNDFFNALALLHSTDDDSAEKLRKMLDAIIERKYGFDKTLMARMPQKFVQNAGTRGTSFSNDKSEKEVEKIRKNENISTKTMNVPLFVTNTMETNWKPINTFDNTVEPKVEDYSEKGDIPTISIPDEGSGDGLLCKICNGAKLGPLILLECQDCQEVYHPLCHQPPVVDIDVYDPRIVWHCSKCTNTAFKNCGVSFEERKVNRSRHHSKTNKTNEVFVDIDKSIKMEDSLPKNKTIIGKKIPSDISQKTSCGKEGTLFVKDAPLLVQKMKNISSNQLKKRIGSKLSVTRSVIK